MAEMTTLILAREALEAKYSTGHRNMGESGRQDFSDANEFWKDELLYYCIDWLVQRKFIQAM